MRFFLVPTLVGAYASVMTQGRVRFSFIFPVGSLEDRGDDRIITSNLGTGVTVSVASGSPGMTVVELGLYISLFYFIALKGADWYYVQCNSVKKAQSENTVQGTTNTKAQTDVTEGPTNLKQDPSTFEVYVKRHTAGGYTLFWSALLHWTVVVAMYGEDANVHLIY